MSTNTETLVRPHLDLDQHRRKVWRDNARKAARAIAVEAHAAAAEVWSDAGGVRAEWISTAQNSDLVDCLVGDLEDDGLERIYPYSEFLAEMNEP